MSSDSPFEDSPFEISLRVYYEDTDASGVVYHANYLKFMERARTEFLRAVGQEHQKMISAGRFFVVAETTTRFIRPARLDDQLQVTAEIVETGRARLIFQQAVMRAGEVLCTGDFTVACVDRPTMKPVSITKALRSKCVGLTNKSKV